MEKKSRNCIACITIALLMLMAIVVFFVLALLSQNQVKGTDRDFKQIDYKPKEVVAWVR